MRQKTSIADKHFNFFTNYKIKNDIKETGVNPYSIPFNYEVLIEKQKRGAAKDVQAAYKEYLLPDGKTVMNIVPGMTENRIYQALEFLYYDSTLLKSVEMPFEKGYLVAEESERALNKRI